MDELEYKRKEVIKKVLDNPLFKGVIDEIRFDLGQKMLKAEDDRDRASLFAENKALDRVVGKLTAIANQVRKLEKLNATG